MVVERKSGRPRTASLFIDTQLFFFNDTNDRYLSDSERNSNDRAKTVVGVKNQRCCYFRCQRDEAYAALAVVRGKLGAKLF